jgi:hypothetical protein
MKNASDVVLEIAKTMHSPGDQLALYMTCPPNNDGLSTAQPNFEVMSFTPPNYHKLRTELQALVPAPSGLGYIPNLKRAVIQASDNLRSLNHAPVLHVRAASRTIILVSPKPDDMMHEIPLLDDGVTLHCISPSIIPGEADANAPFGWFMNQMNHSDNEDNKESKDEIAGLVKNMLATSRFHSSMGNIHTVQISFQLGQETSLLHRNGELRLSTLLPGQNHTIALHLQVNPLQNSAERQQSRFGSNVALARAFSEVEETLDTRLRELLTVNVSYKNSHYPENTTLEAKEVLWIRRPNSRRSLEEYGEPHSADQNKMAVRKAVALKFASRPDATAALQSLIRKTREFNLPKDFSEPIKEELIFQADVQDTSYTSRALAVHQVGSPSESTVRYMYGTREQEARSETYQRLTGRLPTTAIRHMQRNRTEAVEEDNEDDDDIESIWRSYAESTPNAPKTYDTSQSGVNRYASPT